MLKPIKKKFKHMTDLQIMELSEKIEQKLLDGCKIEEAILLVQCYACVEELILLRLEKEKDEHYGSMQADAAAEKTTE